jgi:hypothetical protein
MTRREEEEKQQPIDLTFEIRTDHVQGAVVLPTERQKIQSLLHRHRPLASIPQEQEQVELAGQYAALERTNTLAMEMGVIKNPVVHRPGISTGQHVVITSFVHPVDSKFRHGEQLPYVTECQNQLFQYHKIAHRLGIRLPLHHEGEGGVRPNFPVKFPEGKILPCFEPEAQQYFFDHPAFLKDTIDRAPTTTGAKLSFLDMLGDVQRVSLQSSETTKLKADFKARYQDAYSSLLHSQHTSLKDLPRAVEAVEKFDELCAQMEEDFVESGSRSSPEVIHRMMIGHAHVHPVVTELLRRGVEVVVIDPSANPYGSVVGRIAGTENERYRWAKNYLKKQASE